MRKTAQYILGASALIVSVVLAIDSTPKGHDAIHNALPNVLPNAIQQLFFSDGTPKRSSKKVDVYDVPLDKDLSFYWERNKLLHDELNTRRVTFDDEKRARYWKALKETDMQIIVRSGDTWGGAAVLEEFCQMCYTNRDIDSLKTVEKELENLKGANVRSYRARVRNEILLIDVHKAIDEKNDRELEKLIEQYEDAAIEGSLTLQNAFFYRLRTFVDPIVDYNPQLGEKAKQAIIRGYENSICPLLAESKILK